MVRSTAVFLELEIREVNITRRQLVAVRNVLVELCCGARFEQGNPEFHTIIGFERDRVLVALDRVNLALAARSAEVARDGFVERVSEDGELFTVDSTHEDVRVFVHALGQAGYVWTGNLWAERGGGFKHVSPKVVVEAEPGDFTRRIGISEKQVVDLKELLKRGELEDPGSRQQRERLHRAFRNYLTASEIGESPRQSKLGHAAERLAELDRLVKSATGLLSGEEFDRSKLVPDGELRASLQSLSENADEQVGRIAAQYLSRLDLIDEVLDAARVIRRP